MPLTRRAFLTRAAAVGIAAGGLGTVVAACEWAQRASAPPTALPSAPQASGPLVTARPSFTGTPPAIDPPPLSATYGEMLETSTLFPVDVTSPALASLVAEVAADARIPLAPGPVEGLRQARLRVTADDPSIGSQSYRLDVARTADGPDVRIRAADEPGAYYGLLSLGQLVVADSMAIWLRAASVDDAPGFTRRGAILDPFAWPDTRITDATRATLLERLRHGVRHKLNYLTTTPWPELVRWCDDHHVELMVAVGFHDRPTPTPLQELKNEIDAQLGAGLRSLSLTTDENRVTDPETVGRLHAAVFAELCDYIRARDDRVRVSVLLPVYGGIPGKRLVNAPSGNGERYLAIIRDGLPAEIPTFWTGDAGVFSPTVTTAGARAYAEAVGRDLFFWDNDAIRSSRDRTPCSGRSKDLDTVAHGYLANLNSAEASWTGTNGEFALLTALAYAWNPGTYEPNAAGAAAERDLAAT